MRWMVRVREVTATPPLFLMRLRHLAAFPTCEVKNTYALLCYPPPPGIAIRETQDFASPFYSHTWGSGDRKEYRKSNGAVQIGNCKVQHTLSQKSEQNITGEPF